MYLWCVVTRVTRERERERKRDVFVFEWMCGRVEEVFELEDWDLLCTVPAVPPTRPGQEKPQSMPARSRRCRRCRRRRRRVPPSGGVGHKAVA